MLLRDVRYVRGPRALSALIAAAAALVLLAWGLLPVPDLRAVGLLVGDPGTEIAFGRFVVIAAGLGMVLLARGLWRGNRRALGAVVGTLTIVGAVAVADGNHPLLGALAIAGAGLLSTQSRAFVARGGARRFAISAAGVAVVAVLAGSLVAAVALVVTAHDATFGGALSHVGRWLTSGDNPPPSDGVIVAVLDALAGVALLSLVAGLHAVLGPRAAREGHDCAAHHRATDVLAAHAADSLDPFALRPDKSFHFAHGGMLAYRTIKETAVVSGDPIGPPGTAGTILADFRAYAERRGWTVVMTAASERHLADYRALGLHVLRLGDEAVVDPSTLRLEGGDMKSVRKAVNRVDREGWRITCLRGDDLDEATVRDLARTEATWRSRQPQLRGFAMTLGRLWGAPEDSGSLYVLGHDATGELSAFLRFAAYPNGLSLDAMRRLSDRPNGVTEALTVAALRHAAADGIREVSLNFAGFSHLMAPSGELSLLQRLARVALTLVHGRFQLDRLARFNDKFSPAKRRRHLVYPGWLALPRAALRVLQAEAYAPAPKSRPLPARWEPAAVPVMPLRGDVVAP